jgi:hypothetical protein
VGFFPLFFPPFFSSSGVLKKLLFFLLRSATRYYMKAPWPAKTTVTALVPDSAAEASRVFARCGFGRGPLNARSGMNAYMVDKDQPNPDRVVGAELRERGEGMRDARDASRERERRASEIRNQGQAGGDDANGVAAGMAEGGQGAHGQGQVGRRGGAGGSTGDEKPMLLRDWEAWEEWTWEDVKRGASWI